ncbi:MAG: aminoglycoside phosphotransferase family protein [Acidimicrobiia bacterium]|nr:aminoglycoside phosphotransferase family protein [Acidimicrobiia bacterium]
MTASLADAVRVIVEPLLGPIRVDATPVDHHERLVWLATRPDGPVVVKADTRADAHRRERSALLAHHRRGRPVPRLIDHHRGPVNILILTHLPGSPLVGSDRSHAWRAVGAALRELHATPLTGHACVGDGYDADARVGRSLDYALGGENDLATALITDGADFVRRHLTAEVSGLLVHGDCQPDHFLLDDDRRNVTGIIDFGDAGLGDPLWDLAVLTVDHPERLPDVLDGYQPNERLAARAERELPAYHALRCLTDIRWLREHGFDPGYCTDRLAQLLV